MFRRRKELDKILPLLRDMAHEFAPNTGNSLRDRVNAIEDAQNTHSADHVRLAASINELHARIDNLHMRIDHSLEELMKALGKKSW
jgi:hypothetical protein